MSTCDLCHDFAVLSFLSIIVDLGLSGILLYLIPRLPLVRKSDEVDDSE